jgi:hypothetical protein
MMDLYKTSSDYKEKQIKPDEVDTNIMRNLPLGNRFEESRFYCGDFGDFGVIVLLLGKKR